MSRKKSLSYPYKTELSLEHRSKVITQEALDDGCTHIVRVYNGPNHITHITETDHRRIMESLEADLQVNCTNGGNFLVKHQQEMLFNRTILDRIVRVLAFELAGTFDVEVYIPQYVFVNSVRVGSGPHGWEAEELNIDLDVNLRLDVIPSLFKGK